MGVLNEPTVDTGTLAKHVGLAIAIALVVNLVILTTVLGLGLLPEYEALAYAPVTMLTVLGVVGAGVVYIILDRVSENHNRLFTWIAVVVLLLSFVPNILIYQSEEAATLGIVLTLMGMHVPPAAASVVSLTGRLDSLFG
jgi:hypothetical protein